MTDQEAFDTALFKLREQGVRSLRVEVPGALTMCVYRAPNGVKCAVGHLIPDEHYSPELEGNEVTRLPPELMNSVFAGVNPDLLADMQFVHDVHMPETKGAPLDRWEGRMKLLAEKFGLAYTAPKE